MESYQPTPLITEQEQEAYKHFKETLFNDLRENLKPVIMSLTMLAEDYNSYGHLIAKSIDEYIRNVSIFFFVNNLNKIKFFAFVSACVHVPPQTGALPYIVTIF
jgi:hypothetical protein